MIMFQSTHDAIVAAKDAEIAKLTARLELMTDSRQRTLVSEVRNALLAADRAKEIRRLEARLAVFTAPRQRDAKGHFVSAKGVS